jgi:mannose-6-phosphate isomerase-like protein (cupin superfamily)
MRTGLAAFVFATLLVPGRTAQDLSAKVFGAPDISRILNKSSDPNPFSELTKGEGFRVTIRRRTRLDVAIRHERRVEVYHILDGSATLVTGGQLRAPKKGANEGDLEGTGIESGVEQVVKKGAVVVIEAGVPHWFSKINGHIDYTTTWIYR